MNEKEWMREGRENEKMRNEGEIKNEGKRRGELREGGEGRLLAALCFCPEDGIGLQLCGLLLPLLWNFGIWA